MLFPVYYKPTTRCLYSCLCFYILRAPFKEKRGIIRYFNVPLTLQAREVAMCVFLALGMQFHVFTEVINDDSAVRLSRV